MPARAASEQTFHMGSASRAPVVCYPCPSPAGLKTASLGQTASRPTAHNSIYGMDTVVMLYNNPEPVPLYHGAKNNPKSGAKLVRDVLPSGCVRATGLRCSVSQNNPGI